MTDRQTEAAPEMDYDDLVERACGEVRAAISWMQLNYGGVRIKTSRSPTGEVTITIERG